jgi:hypothetical protein
MMKRIVIPFVIGAMLFLLVPAQSFATLNGYWWEDSPGGGVQISSGSVPYGYITHAHLFGGGDLTFDSKLAYRWPTTTPSPLTYKLNMDGAAYASGSDETSVKQKIAAAAGKWYDDLSSTSSLFDLAQTEFDGPVSHLLTVSGSCANHDGFWNTQNEVGFIPLPTDVLACTVVNISVDDPYPGQPILHIIASEADMVFNSDETWSDNLMYATAMHEFGHVYGLSDLYDVYPSGCEGYEIPYQVMCDNVPEDGTTALQWGDRDGIRFLYPKTYSFPITVTGTSIKGSDSAAGSVSGTGSGKDLFIVYSDYNSGTSQTIIKGKMAKDLSSTTGSPASYSSVKTLQTITGSTRDVGATFANVDGDSARDLILTYATTTKSYYKVFFDITSTFGWSSTAGPYELTAVGTNPGIDVALYDMDGTGGPDLLIAVDDTFQDFQYYWAPISAGGLIIGPWISGPNNGEIKINSGEIIGFQMYQDYPDDIFMINFRDDDNYIKQNVIHFSDSGGISNSNRLMYKFAPLKDVGGASGGKVGGGDAVNIGEKSYNDAIYSWVDGTNAYYTIDWDSRLNSHG